ncbi:MAG: hypothetical protein PHT92_10300 [Bacteroidales bacterium]|nr:hypothetical protein [Bacteroidales bacterium]
MSKYIAHTISVLLHPMLMPTYGLLAIFVTNNSMFLLPYDAKRIILVVVAINTLALPLLTIPLFNRMGIIKSIQMHEHRERIIPIAFTLVPYIFSFYFLKRLPIPSEVSLFMLGASINLAIALVVSIWWKISLHMIGIGGLVGLFFALSTRIYFEITTYLIAAVAIAGIVAWARLRLNTHNPPQVYVGFILGWISVASTILLLS